MTLRSIQLRLRAVFRRAAAERDLDDEIRFHLEQEAAKHERSGLAPDEARRRALVAFGGVERTREDYRDARGDRFLSDLRGDVRYAIRTLRRNPTLAVTVILTLGLGIGANVAIFSAVNAVVLRPLPFAEPGRLVALWEDNDDKGWHRELVAPANMLDWQEGVRSLSGIAAYSDFPSELTLTGTGEAQVLRAIGVSGNFFSVLGVRPLLGTGFDDRETWAGSGSRAVISSQAWRARFGGDSGIIGRSILLDGSPVEVAGVVDASIGFPRPGVDVWVPFAWDPASRSQVWFRRAHWLRPFGRLRDGVTIEQARTELQGVMSRLERQFPETNTHMEADLGGLQDWVVGDSRRPLFILLGATGLLLLIACANVGNLLLVRAAAREREVVMRRALGAGAGRIVRQALTESAVLSVVGGASGFLVGWWGTRALVALQPRGLLPVTDVQPDVRVFAFVALVMTCSAALFGMAPALWSARRAPASALQASTRGSSESRRVRAWGNLLVIGEVALALMLMVGAGLLLRSFSRLTRVDPGFDPSGVVAVSLTLPESRYGTAEARRAFLTLVAGEVAALPGVQGAAFTTGLPLRRAGWSSDFSVRGRGPDEYGTEVVHREVSPGYFRTMGVPLVAGRDFTDDDRRGAEAVVVVNKLLADRYFSGQDPVGQYIAFDRKPDSTSLWRRIVGVVGNEAQESLGSPPRIEIFASLAQDPRPRVHLVARTRSDPATLLRATERTIRRLDPGMGIPESVTMDGVRRESLARERFLAALLLAFAGVGTVLAIVGVYGMVAQLAQRRTHEIGIRMALGAQVADVRWLVVRHGVLLTALGITVGVLGAALLGGTLRQLLFGVTPHDAVTYVVTPVVLLLVGLFASWIPAVRTTRGDPLRALPR